MIEKCMQKFADFGKLQITKNDRRIYTDGKEAA